MTRPAGSWRGWGLLVGLGLLALLAAACRVAWPLGPRAVATALPPTPTPMLVPAEGSARAATPTARATPTVAPTATPSPVPTPTPTPAAPPASWPPVVPLTPGPLTLTRLHMVDALRGWAITAAEGDARPRIVVTDDGARTWREVTPPVLPPAAAITHVEALFWDANTAWVAYGYEETDGPATPGVWVTHDRGATWTWASIPWSADMAMPWFAPGSWAAVDAQRAWLLVHLDAGMGHDYALLAATTDGGRSWQVLADPFADRAGDLMTMPSTDMAFAPDGRYGWVTKDLGAVPAAVLVVTRDGGRSWDARTFTPPGADETFCRTRDPHLWAPGQGVVLVQCLLHPNFSGMGLFVAHWDQDAQQALVPVDAPPAANASLVFPTAEEGYLAVYPASDGEPPPYRTQLYISTDRGRTWQWVRDLTWRGVFSWLPGGEGWALADNEREVRVVHTTDRGRTWELLPEPRLVAPEP